MYPQDICCKLIYKTKYLVASGQLTNFQIIILLPGPPVKGYSGILRPWPWQNERNTLFLKNNFDTVL